MLVLLHVKNQYTFYRIGYTTLCKKVFGSTAWKLRKWASDLDWRGMVTFCSKNPNSKFLFIKKHKNLVFTFVHFLKNIIKLNQEKSMFYFQSYVLKKYLWRTHALKLAGMGDNSINRLFILSTKLGPSFKAFCLISSNWAGNSEHFCATTCPRALKKRKKSVGMRF